MLEQAGGERIALVRFGLDDTGHQPAQRVDEHQGWQLTAAQHVVTDAHLAIHDPAHPLVDALVAAADHRQVRLGGELARQRIGQTFACRVHQHDRRSGGATVARSPRTAARVG